jgi:hypothetical protein
MCSAIGSQHEHLAQDGLWLLGPGPIGPYPSSITTGRLHYNAALRDSKGYVDWVSRFFDFDWFHGDGYGSSSADLHHPRKLFMKSVKPTIDKKIEIINMKVDEVHEKFIYHPKNLTCCCQIRVHRYAGSRRVRCVEVLPEQIRNCPQSWNRRLRNAITPDKKPSAAENFLLKFSRHVKNAMSAVKSSPMALVT